MKKIRSNSVPANIFLHELSESPERGPSEYYLDNYLLSQIWTSIYGRAEQVEWGWGLYIVEEYNIRMFSKAIIFPSIQAANGESS